MRAERFYFSCRNVPALAIFILPTREGTHTGILHRDGQLLWVLDQLWHERLRSAPCTEDYACVIPALEPEEVNDVTALCRLIHRRHVETLSGGGFLIPYAFRHAGSARFSKLTGELMLGEGLGLTCATFVLAIFESARVPWIDLAAWPARKEDEAQQARLLKLMCEGIPGFAPPAPREHVQRVHAELPCIRVRPEEVAAAGMADSLPARFQDAERGGQWILEWITVNAGRAWI